MSRTSRLLLVAMFLLASFVACNAQIATNKSASSPETAISIESRVASKTALILVDMQLDFYAGVYPANPQFENNVTNLLEECRRNDVQVIHVRTRMDNDRKNWPASFQTMFPDRIPCIAGTYGAEPMPFAADLLDETVLTKCCFDAFNSGELEALLTKHGVEHVFIAGVTTEVCVLATAMGAMNRGIRVTLVDDCCGSDSAEAHAFVLKHYEGLVFRRASVYDLSLSALSKG